MPDRIDLYLGRLRKALTGCDSATIQDALSDAEEHLRTAFEQQLRNQPTIAKENAMNDVIDKYGTPDEVADAYRQREDHTTPPLARHDDGVKRSFARRFFGVYIEPRAYGALFYMILSLVTGIFYFTWAVTGLSLSIGLIILIIGVPILGLFLLSFHGLGFIEGRLVEALLGVRMPRRTVFFRKDLSLGKRFKALFFGRLTWTTTLYLCLMLAFGIIYFTIFIVMISIALWGILRPVLEIGFDLPAMVIGYNEYYVPYWFMPIAMLFGFLWFGITLHFAKLVGSIHGKFAKLLLVKEYSEEMPQSSGGEAAGAAGTSATATATGE
jgi:uncharacterized membrane protein